ASGWAPFTNGSVLTKDGVNGDWYLHIQAQDTAGNTVNSVSNRFRLDHTGPSMNITMTTAGTKPYLDNTWTNQNVTVSAVVPDVSNGALITYSLDGGATWSGYTAPIVLDNDGVYPLLFKAVDSAGNETVEQRTVKISTSGLRLTPTLTKADGSVYTSGVWTNGSVSVSVFAEAGLSGISALTYSLDGGSAQAYTNRTPIPFAHEGTHPITFNVTDTAGNTLSALLAVNIDLTAPSVSLSANGSETWANAASTSVTVTDSGGSGIDVSTLQYVWSADTTVPASGWTPFTNGSVLTKDGVNGDWYLHIQAQDTAGNTVNSVSNRFRLDNTPRPGTSGGNTTIQPIASPVPNITLNPDGGITLHVDPAEIVKETLPDGTVIEKVIIPENVLNSILEKLKEAGMRIVTIEINDTEQAVQVQLPAALNAAITKSFPDAIINVKVNGSSFQLRVSVLDLDSLAKRLGVQVKDLKVNVILKQADDQLKKEIEQIGASQRFKLFGNVIDFKVTVEANGQTLEIRDFGGTYMARAIVLDEDAADHNLIAVLYDPATKTVSFVPSLLASRADGKREVVMNVPHNSIYTVIDVQGRTFADLSGHWSKGDVELLASKLIVQGVADSRFAPTASVTRAEFTALLVRALGLSTDPSAINSRFTDVAADAWYAAAVEAAVKAGLASGIASDRFAPNDQITREQMAVMIARASTLAGNQAGAVDQQGTPSGQADQKLAKFADYSSISYWAQAAVDQIAGAGIIEGMDNGNFAPSEYATRAQAAVMLKRFLNYVGFIN
ncbi:S-layer homology domain-containing protein, partial [Paenibacillus sp. D51F]